MSNKVEHPITQAVRFLRANRIPFTPRLYPYEDRGGTGRASEMLGVPEHRVIKTLVMQSDDRLPFIVLMHGDREVSTRNLARHLNVKHVQPCDSRDAERLTGCQVGGISPFGTRTRLKVYAEATILELDRIYINCGKRGFLAELDPRDLEKALAPERVTVAITP
jgi:Cys-tRNA(Pro) deacylase